MKDLIKSVPHAIEGVCSCQKDYKICVASNGERTNVKMSLSMLGFDPYFSDDTIFTKIQVEQAKPAPDLFLFAAKTMGIDPARCLVIEDSPTGVAGGKAANMEVWGFIGTAHNKTRQIKILEKAGADKIIMDFIHIHEQLSV